MVGMTAYRALFLLLFSCSLLGEIALAQSLPREEVEALRQIADKLKVPPTLWNFDLDPCTQWPKVIGDPNNHNITCALFTEAVTNANATANTTTNITAWHVVSIDVKAANLSGVLPEELGKLKFLSHVDLSRNYISGSIPAANWTSLPLKDLNILGNRISGTIPDELASIRTLEVLFLESNLLEGSLPPSLGNLTNLDTLLVSCNNISGGLPETLGKLKNLTEVRLDGTQISGKIPSFIGNWTKLKKLFAFLPLLILLKRNLYLQRCTHMPLHLSKLRREVQGTLMEGPFPEEFSLLENLVELRVAGLSNKNGSFPPLSRMKGLRHLVLRNCSISGSIPDYVGSLSKLETVDLSFNNLTGEIPGNLENHRKLNNLYLTNNNLTGSIPDWIKRSRKNIDISYNTFTDLSSAPPDCEQESRNYAASFSSTDSDTIASCLRRDMPCSGTAKNYEIFINCGGERVTVGNKEYEPDISAEGKSTYRISDSRKWAYSSTGNFLGKDKPFRAQNTSTLTMPNSALYTSARLSPLSLKYYGLCLQPGNYTVTLHFAEIIFISGPTYWSLGRRVFDVEIQGQRVLRDFNIAEAANGIGKEVTKNFTVLVEGSALEIHFLWSGQGTNSLPDRGIYGPLISAISVNPNFTPRTFEDKQFAVSGIIGIAVGSALLSIFVIYCLVWCCLRKKAAKNDKMNALQLPTGGFSLKQIKTATRNFSHDNKIGEGGFGTVYKGVLPDGSIIAVKQLSSKSKQGNREFVTEIGMISALQHPNLVRLYGCCVERNQLLLIYEYMENNSLARALFGPEGTKLELDWATRRRICIGIARGLAFLHEESRLKIVHRDIKTTNILLDKYLNAKISDFGLAKLNEEEKTHISTRIAGTMGYMAPEYATRGHLTDKVDVYSFGVVMLEIVSGKNNTKNLRKDDFFYLLDWAYVLQEEGTLLELVDPALGRNFDEEEALQMLNLALVCTNLSASLRPAMSTIVSMLEGDASAQFPTAAMMSPPRTESTNMRFSFKVGDGRSWDASDDESNLNDSLPPKSTQFYSAASLLPDDRAGSK